VDRELVERELVERGKVAIVEGRKWWDAAVVASVIVIAALIWFNSPSSSSRYPIVLVLLAIILIYYFVFGRRAQDGTPAAVVFQFVLIACTVAGAWLAPDFLTLQIIVLPLLWTTAGSTRWALILNVVITMCLTVTFALGLGGSPDTFIQAGTIEAISLGFSIALGLWITRVHEYGSERARLLEELTAAQSKLEQLSRDAGAIDERERLAREIHDTIAQSLTGLVMLAQRAQRETKDPTAGTQTARDRKLNETLSLIETMARETLGDARALVATSAGIPQGDGGLAGAIGRLGERFIRETGTEVKTTVDEGVLPRDIEVVLLRSAQEALANVRKHAGADRVEIQVERSAEVVTLTVADNGRGLADYDPTKEQGFGIAGMRDRIRLVDGELGITERDGGGTILIVRIPLHIDDEVTREPTNPKTHRSETLARVRGASS
jgi:signal transduction histidine kinase